MTTQRHNVRSIAATGYVGDGSRLLADDGSWKAAGGGSGIVKSIVPGTGIAVDDTDPANPVVSATGGGGSGAPAFYTGARVGTPTVNSTTWVDIATVTVPVAATSDAFNVSAFISCLINPGGASDTRVRLVVDGVAQSPIVVWYNAHGGTGAARFSTAPDFGKVTGVAAGSREFKVQVSLTANSGSVTFEAGSRISVLAVS